MTEAIIQNFEDLEYQQSEAMNTLCTNLSLAGGDIKKILITSCHPQEGKSFISMNLLRSMAGLGMKVLLIDADLRASILQQKYSIEISSAQKYKGLCGYLSGVCSIDDIIGKTNIPGADIILAGKTVLNALPLINSPRLGELLETVTPNYDLVLIDAPPVGAIIDAAKLAVQCDGALFVVHSGEVSVGELKSATAQIEKTGCPIMGYVLNKVRLRNHGKYGKYYTYYHAEEGSG